MLFENDVVLVAGATGNVGIATLATLVREGAQVGVLSRSLTNAQRAIDAQLPPAQRDRAMPLVADLHDPDGAAAAVAACRDRFGRIDALINLAGDSATMPLLKSTLADLHTNIDGYLTTAYNLTLPVLRVMLAQPFAPGALSRGHIVTVTAGSSLDPAPGRGLFGAAKAGVNILHGRRSRASTRPTASSRTRWYSAAWRPSNRAPGGAPRHGRPLPDRRRSPMCWPSSPAGARAGSTAPWLTSTPAKSTEHKKRIL